MILKITDGVTTVILNDDNGTPTEPFVGARYFPRDPGSAATVTETADVSFSGTNSLLKTKANDIERLLDQAKYSHLPTVYIEYHHQITGYPYRSPVVGGRVTWSEERPLREVYQGNAFGVISVVFERANYWESTENVSLGLTAIKNGNNGQYNFFNLADIQGSLPAPVIIKMTNANGPLATNKFYLNTDLGIGLSSNEYMLAGGSFTWDANVTHGTRLFTAPIPTAVLEKSAGQHMHILAGFSSLVAGVLFLRGNIYTSLGGIHILAHAGNEKEVGFKKLINLGVLPVPPGGIANADVAFALSGYSANAGSATLDFVQMMPALNAVELTQTGYNLAINAFVVDDSANAESYYGTGDNRYNIINRSGGPLVVYPGRTNKLTILFDEGASFTQTRNLLVNVNYRPRWSTI